MISILYLWHYSKNPCNKKLYKHNTKPYVLDKALYIESIKADLKPVCKFKKKIKNYV